MPKGKGYSKGATSAMMKKGAMMEHEPMEMEEKGKKKGGKVKAALGGLGSRLRLQSPGMGRPGMGASNPGAMRPGAMRPGMGRGGPGGPGISRPPPGVAASPAGASGGKPKSLARFMGRPKPQRGSRPKKPSAGNWY